MVLPVVFGCDVGIALNQRAELTLAGNVCAIPFPGMNHDDVRLRHRLAIDLIRANRTEVNSRSKMASVDDRFFCIGRSNDYVGVENIGGILDGANPEIGLAGEIPCKGRSVFRIRTVYFYFFHRSDGRESLDMGARLPAGTK